MKKRSQKSCKEHMYFIKLRTENKKINFRYLWFANKMLTVDIGDILGSNGNFACHTTNRRAILCNSRLPFFELHLQITFLKCWFDSKNKEVRWEFTKGNLLSSSAISVTSKNRKNRRNALPGPSGPVFSLQQRQERCYLGKVLEPSHFQQQIPPSVHSS